MTYNKETVMEVLEKLGKEHFRKIYKKHGSGNNVYGVSMSDLKTLQKEIKKNSELAHELWETGNSDARALAIFIIDPDDMTENIIENWVSDIKFYMLIDILVTNVINKTSFAKQLSEKWIKSKEEGISRAGWQTITLIAMHQKDLPDIYFEKLLEFIEKNIHTSKNRCKDAMNNALIGIGLRNENLEKKVFECMKKIGKIEVDYGDTACETPDVIEYIKKAKARRKK
jgi:3-methyladenine DNA glycosylase AlkD